MTTTTTDTTTMPAGPNPEAPSWAGADGDYAGYLDTLRYVRDRETAAQVLESMAAVAAATGRKIRDVHPETERFPDDTWAERASTLTVVASGGWQRDALGWAETATLLHQLGCALRGHIPEVRDFDDRYGWARGEWEDLADAWTPAEFTAAYTVLRAQLAGPGGEDDDWGDGRVHPDALTRLEAAAAAIAVAPWGL